MVQGGYEHIASVKKRTALLSRKIMKLKKILLDKYGSILRASKELGFSQQQLSDIVNNEDSNITVETIKRITKNGVCVTFNNNKVTWFYEQPTK